MNSKGVKDPAPPRFPSYPHSHAMVPGLGNESARPAALPVDAATFADTSTVCDALEVHAIICEP